MSRVLLEPRSDDWIWSARWPEAGVTVTDAACRLAVDGRTWRLGPAGEATRGKETRGEGTDVLGHAVEILHPLGADGLPVRARLKILVYEAEGILAVEGEITNDGAQACALGDFELAAAARVDLGGKGREVRAYVERSLAHPSIEAVVDGDGKGLAVDSQGMVTVAAPGGRCLTAGFLSAAHHRPVARLEYRPGTDEILVSLVARHSGRLLEPGQVLVTGWALLRADADPLAALETYGDLIARVQPPRRTPATMGWCSWYACRLPISHAFAAANGRVMAERFRDLGMDLVLLDHGWQTGDICGDWDPDPADYPEGMEGLARDLTALGLKLGLWISPTDIAHTSRLYRQRPEWMLRDETGRPAITWRWYWEPYPLQSQLDATQEGAYRYIVEAFRRLTAAGASYYKIDFIAGCSGEHLHPADPRYTRGWEPLRRAMEAVREGAGDSYVRYCQTPPLLSTGLADGVYATNDTLDAGSGSWRFLLDAFRMSSAQYWIHRRLYVHEACDLSVRAQGSTEECRLRVTMLELSGSSIMFSDDLTRLPEERLRLMQQCLPAVDRAARPLNLFTAEWPDLWHLPVEAAGLRWDLVALYNFEDEVRTAPVSWSALGLPPGEARLVREFWTGDAVGVRTDQAELVVPARCVRLYSLWPVGDAPTFAGTDLHLAQGLVELHDLRWDGKAGRLAGRLRRAAGVEGHLFLHAPAPWQVRGASHPVQASAGGLLSLSVSFPRAEVEWHVDFERGPAA
ncbi:MAG: alpha-galactosidase [Gemmatimonadota bacterium]